MSIGSGSSSSRESLLEFQPSSTVPVSEPQSTISTLRTFAESIQPTKNKSCVKRKHWKKEIRYYFNEQYVDEFSVFSKYYAAIIEQSYYMWIMVHSAEKLGDTCSLFANVNKAFYKKSLNLLPDDYPIADHSEDILYASKLVTLKESLGKGRYLEATSTIVENTVLINEPPTVLQVNPLCMCEGHCCSSLYRCHNCGIACKTFLICEGCNICIFCSKRCQNIALKNYHIYECRGLATHFWPLDDNTDYSYISLRMMLYGFSTGFNIEPIDVSSYGNKDNNYPFLNSLEMNLFELSPEKLNEVLFSAAKNVVYLIECTHFFGLFADKFSRPYDAYLYIGGILVKHYCQAQANSILIKFPNLHIGFGCTGISNYGKAICPTVALLNHSCTPNATITLFCNNIVVKSIKPIKKGEEITICYTEVTSIRLEVQRRAILLELFNFICNCTRCQYERILTEAPYKCLVCKEGHAKAIAPEYNNMDYQMYCLTCKNYFPPDEINKNIAQIQIYEKEILDKSYSRETLKNLAEYSSKIYLENSLWMVNIYDMVHMRSLGCCDVIEIIKYGLLYLKTWEHYMFYLRLPIIENKIKFIYTIAYMPSFSQLKRVTENEFEIIHSFLSEIIALKNTILFYTKPEMMDAYQYLLEKVESVHKNVTVVTIHQEKKQQQKKQKKQQKKRR